MLRIESTVNTRSFRTQEINCDLVVIGGGLAGVCCAITAAREGLQVTLIQDRPVLGGNASSEVRLWALGATSHMGNNNRWAREGGVINEIIMENLYRNSEGNPIIFDTVLLEKVIHETHITLLLNTVVFQLEKHDSESIRCVRGFCSQNSTLYEVFAPLFCDASGDGTAGYLAGAPFRMGAETRDEFGEKFAPSAEYGHLMGHSIFFYSKDTGAPVEFIPPAYALKDITRVPRYRNFRPNAHGCQLWWIEYGGRLDTIHDSEEIKWELWKIVHGVWNHIKNSGDFTGVDTLALEWVGLIPGKRESRRFEGDYMLIQQDIVEQRQHYDAVSFGGWAIDLHPADGIYSDQPGCDQWHAKGVYQIPYRCMYSRSIRNLFLAGRILSASHVANGSTRVMMTCAHNAQAVGVAAALCIRHELLPRDLAAPEQIKSLQQRLLALGQYIPGLVLRDQQDLVQTAEIAASSCFKLDALPPDDVPLPLTDSWAMMIPLDAGRVPCMYFTIEAEKETTLECELRIGSKRGNFVPDVIVASARIPVSCNLPQSVSTVFAHSPAVQNVSYISDLPGAAAQEDEVMICPQEVELDFDVSLDEAQYAFVCLKANPDVRVFRSPHRVTGILSACFKGNFRVNNGPVQKPARDIGVDTMEFWIPERFPDGRNLAMRVQPALDRFAPENIRNGICRPTTESNAWVAAIDDKTPSLTLNWSRPQTIRRIELSYDPDWDHPMESVQMGHPANVVPCCVRQFRILDAVNRVIYECRENHQARVTIVLDSPVMTDKLTLELKSPGKFIPAALFEVRCYE